MLATKSALIRDFPGCAVGIPDATLHERAFLDNLSSFLQQASTEYVTKFSSVAYKAAAPLPEVRNTSDPAIVTGLLMTILEANGATKDVTILRKRVRDTVMFDQAFKPWRRSPFYLIVRVAIQRHLYTQVGPAIGRLYFKTIMCLVLNQFLEDVLKKIPFEAVSFLRKKLGRRLAKLTSDRTSLTESVRPPVVSALTTLEPIFESTLVSSGNWLKARWRNYRQAHERIVPPLQPLVPKGAFNMSLTNSQPVLSRILANQAIPVAVMQRTPDDLLKQYDESAASVKPYMYAARTHIQVSQHHKSIIQPAKQANICGHSRVIELSAIIRDYIHQVQISPDGYPEQKSLMLLHLMELWILMDIEAVACFPLLEDFHPGFGVDLMDPIEILSLHDMKRVQKVQVHINSRVYNRNSVRPRTIFDDPSDDCFAARYFDKYDDALQPLRLEIEEHAGMQRTAKEAEWEEKSEIHADIIKSRDQTACFYDEVPHRFTPGITESRHRWPCEWHELHNSAKAIDIRIYEHPLPSFEPAAKAAMFELKCPPAFAAYRDATWSILAMVCSSSPPNKPERISTIRRYPPLQQYVDDLDCCVTLASEKKAFSETHYARWHFPIELDDIIRTCGLKPKYYDQSSQSWTAMAGKATLWHHFPVILPSSSPLRVLQLTYATWPSSNEIQASQADCPSDVSAHELTALQGLLVGTHSRWLDLVRELGSTNLNFSTDTAWALVMRLSLQLGPASDIMEARRDVHTALLDETLCSSLLHQIHLRIDAVKQNWREPVQMDILITVLLKILSLVTSDVVVQQASALLVQVRHSTDLWRVELQAAVTNDARLRPFAVSASLLCKRTLHIDPGLLLDPAALELYVSASISLNYNLVEEFTYLPHRYKCTIIRDVLFSYDHRDLLRQSLLRNMEALVAAVNRLWQMPDGYAPNISESATGSWWVLLELRHIGSNHKHSYYVHYNYVYGTLLIDGQEMSTLPLTYRRNPLYRSMYGDRNPMVFPSALPGMSWTVSEPEKGGQHVHLGFRQNVLVVRATRNGSTYEFIPQGVFGTTSRDLPAPFLKDCYHWLDVRSGEIEIRRQEMWISRPGNWWIHGLAYGQCQIVRRAGFPGETRLLNSSNETVQHISTIFRHFTDLNQIIVFAALNGKITVELKSLELSFFISSNGLLHSPRLGAVITANQDAGTWYGLRSKLVIQSAANHRQKSILVPYSSDIHTTQDTLHVSVDIGVGSNKYLKYDINEVLGRVDCPPEPSLLYTKALLHALTSHVLPDPLTSRTGTNEALRLLQTGLYQPWSPLNESHIALLERLAELSPERGYYPPESLQMETLVWRTNLTRNIQDDRFRACVDIILRRNTALIDFSPGIGKQEANVMAVAKPNSHLAARAVSRTYLQSNQEDDRRYLARDKRKLGVAQDSVSALTRQLLDHQISSIDSPSLLSLLHDAPIVGGYDRVFQKVLLTDLLTVDIRVEWGALTQRAMRCDPQDHYQLMFLLGTIAFSNDAKIDLLHKLIRFIKCEGIRDLQPPQHAAYFHFRADGAPPVSYLVSLMEKSKLAFSPIGFKKRAQIVVAENNHSQYVDKSCEDLALSIQAQWPASDIDLAKLVCIDPTHVDVARAVADIIPEWQRLIRNHELAIYLEQVQSLLDRSDPTQSGPSGSSSDRSGLRFEQYTRSKPQQVFPSRNRDRDVLSLPQILQESIRGVVFPYHGVLTDQDTLAQSPANGTQRLNQPSQSKGTYAKAKKPALVQKIDHTREISRLRNIVNNLRAKSSHSYTRYADEMNISIDALQLHLKAQQNVPRSMPRWISPDDLRLTKDNVKVNLDQIQQGLATHFLQAGWLQLVDLWPSVTILDLLTELRSTSSNIFGKGTKEAVVSLGVAVTKHQQSLRIYDAQKRRKDQQRDSELANPGHTNWNPVQYTDWLLIEIDGDVMLREEQVQVALATIAPASGQNAVLQLLMGKGKTSCILRKSILFSVQDHY